MSISINKKYSFEISINSPTILVRNHSQLNQLDYESSGHTGFASSDEFSSHIENTNNPHSVTKAQVELSNVDNTSDLDKPVSTAQQISLDNKVDKVEGKGLSANDYTNIDKQSVEKIPTIEQDILDLESDKVDKNNAITAGTKAKITYDAKGLVTSGADLEATDIPELPQSKITNLGTDLGNKVNKNADIVGATKAKITYDSKGLVTAGADLVASDIPNLDAGKITTGTFVVDRIPALAPSKITQDTNNRFVTDTEKSTWNSKQSALGFTPENQENKKTTLTNSDVDFPTTKAVKTAIDTAISQTLKPMGNWNASTNTPTLTNSDTSKANQVYYVSVAGTQFDTTFGVGDELVYNTNGVIFKRDNVDAVISVNGKEGVVDLTQDNVADGSTYKRVTETEKTTWNNKVDSNTAITGATKTKITYDAKGLVTGGSDLVPSDIGAEPAFAKNTAFNKNFGNENDTVCEGNDVRLSDARTPLSHTHDDRYYTESEVDTLLDDITPVKGVDYWTESDKGEIIQAVVDVIGGALIGYVDENNNIILVGGLVDETYTVKYETEGGSTIVIGELTIGDEFDNGVFEPDNAKLNYRLRSTGVEEQLNGVFYTQNYIPLTSANTYLYIKGCTISTTVIYPQSYCGIFYYTSDKTFLGKVDAFVVAVGRNNTEIVDATNKIYRLKIGTTLTSVALSYASEIAYARLVVPMVAEESSTAITSDDVAKVVIKIDEEIA